MKTITSISGGKTSAYMAINFPTEYNIFSLIRIEDSKCTPKDIGFVKAVENKINMDFVATAESDDTLRVVLELEQILGREIIWVTGDTFEEVIRKKKALPNLMMRFCTTELKIKPIFDYCHEVIQEPVLMSIGFRYDEQERANSQNTHFKTIVGRRGNKNKWGEVYWRELSYPLIKNQITHYPIHRWAINSGLPFPPDSNCVGCFWKHLQQLRKNWNSEPLKMQWFADMEGKMKRRFKKEMSMSRIKTIGIQSDFNFGTGAGCQAGFCTD